MKIKIRESDILGAKIKGGGKSPILWREISDSLYSLRLKLLLHKSGLNWRNAQRWNDAESYNGAFIEGTVTYEIS
jgi:hypothetical protein